jgi:hypothetical protein
MSRDSITPAQLGLLPADTPVTLVSSRSGYAAAVGPAHGVRWLHSARGAFLTFRTVDHALTLLAAHGIRRITLDLNGGLPQ